MVAMFCLRFCQFDFHMIVNILMIYDSVFSGFTDPISVCVHVGERLRNPQPKLPHFLCGAVD